MDAFENFEELRRELLASEVFGYVRLPNKFSSFFMGSETLVRSELARVLQGHDGDELPIVIARVTEENMRRLLGLTLRANMHKPANGLNVHDGILLGDVCKSYFGNPEDEREEWES